ncbi:hypothetical protein KBB96_01315 [Luteolibacter ambystomatis]|uniref:Secreted protein n=1 Tax=Luteolibacter ambystomatis TaxID=2824561 RepID=A0A975G9Y4_9BACT|nr:hypothetical protein [Luteolibacter ambystomatis]QUE51546.1 hypothetical protein KBB96_01315 [Luteolibacter ambystomatis]
MKRPVLSGAVALTFACTSPLLAQDLSGASRQFESGSAPTDPIAAKGFSSGSPIQPLVGVSPESFSKDQPWYLVQDPISLGFSEVPVVTRPWSLESQLRKNAAPFLKSVEASRSQGMLAMAANRAPAKELNFALSLLAAMYRSDATPAKGESLSDVEYALNIRHRIHEDPSKLLEIVAAEVTANPDRVCEIVKAAIKATENDKESIANIVETAATTKPDAMRLAAQCAVAAVPESLADVQAVLAKLDPATGDKHRSSKDSKDSKDAKDAKEEVAPAITPPNPLDLPPPPPPIPPIPPPPPPSTNTEFRHFNNS